jgi:ABC-type uncharacterized transport system permease subunit
VIDTLSLAALVCFAVASTLAIASFWREGLRDNRVQFGLAAMGLALKTASIGVFCVQSETHFFNSPAEITGLLGWALAFSFLTALAVYATRSLGAIILPIVTLLMALSHILPKDGPPLATPAGNLLAPHILSAFLGYGLFLTACGASVLYLEQSRMLRRKVFGVLFRELPSLERLEKLEVVCAWLGLLAFAIAIGTGAVMTKRLNRPFWTDPKILAAEVTWLVFLLLLLGRAINRLHGRRSARFVLIGAGLVVATFVLSHPIGKAAPANSNPQPASLNDNGPADREGMSGSCVRVSLRGLRRAERPNRTHEIGARRDGASHMRATRAVEAA